MTFCPQCRATLTLREIDGRRRLSCPQRDCGYVFWDNPTPVVAAIVDYRGTVVLARNRAWPEDMFGLITGFLERGETPAEGVLREVREELGLSGQEARLVGVYAFLEMNQLIVAYHVPATGEITLSDELAEIRRVAPAELRPWPFGTGPALSDWLAQRA